MKASQGGDMAKASQGRGRGRGLKGLTFLKVTSDLEVEGPYLQAC